MDMIRDLSSFAGFALQFDPTTLAITASEGVAFLAHPRRANQLREVLESPNAIAPETELYSVFNLSKCPFDVQQRFDRWALTYSLVLLRAGRVGREFIKTAGHFHPLAPGTPWEYPEVYTVLDGHPLLFLQRRAGDEPEPIAEIVLLRLAPGETVTIPPGYAHVLINPYREPALTAGLYSTAFEPDYEPVRAMHGLAYYVVNDSQAGEQGYALVPNPAYHSQPPVHRIDTLIGGPFAPVDAGIPLWRSYLEEPSSYAFLSDPEAMTSRYRKRTAME